MKLQATLSMDALCFHAAREALASTATAQPAISRAEKRIQGLVNKEQRILAKYNGNEHKAYDDLEPIYIQMEDASGGLNDAYGPLLQALVRVHILSACAAEAHINIRAEELLDGSAREQFDKLSLEGKWLFLPKLVGVAGFSPGREPYQALAQLASFRNALVHYKPRRVDWLYLEVPRFPKLGLTLEAADRSLEAVSRSITMLATQLKLAAPYWLRDGIESTSYFAIEAERVFRPKAS